MNWTDTFEQSTNDKKMIKMKLRQGNVSQTCMGIPSHPRIIKNAEDAGKKRPLLTAFNILKTPFCNINI